MTKPSSAHLRDCNIKVKAIRYYYFLSKWKTNSLYKKEIHSIPRNVVIIKC